MKGAQGGFVGPFFPSLALPHPLGPLSRLHLALHSAFARSLGWLVGLLFGRREVFHGFGVTNGGEESKLNSRGWPPIFMTETYGVPILCSKLTFGKAREFIVRLFSLSRWLFNNSGSVDFGDVGKEFEIVVLFCRNSFQFLSHPGEGG